MFSKKQSTAIVLAITFTASMFLFTEGLPSGNQPAEGQSKWGNHYSPSAADKKAAEEAKKAVENQSDPRHPLYFPGHHSTRPHTEKEADKDDHARHRGIGNASNTGNRGQ
ncbi:uncharacterized protein FA14DRAFT_177808 [Meira miltonrushii]|uniref:Uncharacterized protein n=1 Tax=Meira miltonrushii TaxID=1280837 RepID=A0A316VMM9_9BASI|nr:uncharacterized protein FA14DRAFT_177808 [Meira miltonrushii]PWN38544.1 hypothetical protein FA14DRAFT_177808 [Meira miltonrushii]